MQRNGGEYGVQEVRTPEQMERAGQTLLRQGAQVVLVKGGHLDGDTIVDVLVSARGVHRFTHPRIDTAATHGTGCTFSAAIAAGLAKGMKLVDAVALAKSYVTLAMQHAYPVGGGAGPLHHFYRYWQPTGLRYRPGVAPKPTGSGG